MKRSGIAYPINFNLNRLPTLAHGRMTPTRIRRHTQSLLSFRYSVSVTLNHGDTSEFELCREDLAGFMPAIKCFHPSMHRLRAPS